MFDFVSGLAVVAAVAVVVQALSVGLRHRTRRREVNKRREFAKKALATYELAVARKAAEYTRIGTSNTVDLRDYYVMQGISCDDGSGLVTPTDIMRGEGNWLIVGDAGFGKSTLAKQAVYPYLCMCGKLKLCVVTLTFSRSIYATIKGRDMQ